MLCVYVGPSSPHVRCPGFFSMVRILILCVYMDPSSPHFRHPGFFSTIRNAFFFETFFRRSFFLCLYVDPSSPHLPLSRHCAFVFRVSFRQLQRSPCGVRFRILPEPPSFFLCVDMDPSSPLWCLYRDPSCLIFGSVTPSDVAPRALTFPVHLL